LARDICVVLHRTALRCTSVLFLADGVAAYEVVACYQKRLAANTCHPALLRCLRAQSLLAKKAVKCVFSSVVNSSTALCRKSSSLFEFVRVCSGLFELSGSTLSVLFNKHNTVMSEGHLGQSWIECVVWVAAPFSCCNVSVLFESARGGSPQNFNLNEP
jgi:hypothetical protein